MAIAVGDYIISHPKDGKVWIHNRATGEGGQFDVTQVNEALNALWRKEY